MAKNFFLINFLLLSILFSDRGLIPLNPGVTIFEPNQRAIIAWNGEEEILLLATDLNASDSTMVLEILPLPSEPKVKKGDLETFRKVVNLINQKIRMPQKRNGRSLAEGIIPPPAEIIFHEKIGVHDISVAHLKGSEGFVNWIKDYLESLGYEREIIGEEHKKLVESYIDSGFAWFAFDVVTLNKEAKTLDPIQYHFQTKRLFYPLKITSFVSGNTTIELIILTPRLLSQFPSLPIEMINLAHEPITINTDDLKNIDEDMYELLKGYRAIKVRIWKIEGELKTFNRDLIAH